MGNGRIIFRIAAGGYLAYLGFRLITNSMQKRPENHMWFMVAGAVFAILGVFLVIRSLLTHTQQRSAQNYEDVHSEIEEKDTDASTEIKMTESEQAMAEQESIEGKTESQGVDSLDEKEEE